MKIGSAALDNERNGLYHKNIRPPYNNQMKCAWQSPVRPHRKRDKTRMPTSPKTQMRRLAQGRAYLFAPLFALNALAQPPTPPATEKTLWDVLSETPPQAQQTQTSVQAQAPRQRLGPIPGFTLPAPPNSQAVGESVFAPRKAKSKGLFEDLGGWISRVQKTTGTKIDLKGESRFTLRMDNVSGNSDAFQSDTYLGRGSNGFYNETSMDVDATFLKNFHYRTLINNNILNNANDPNYNRSQLEYSASKTKILYGDISAGFQGNSLINFNRYLNGVQYTQTWSNNLKTSVLYSRTRAETRTIAINGNGSAGPYYVYAGQIVDGSAKVRVNNIDMVIGTDFTLDQYTGELRFLNGRVILPTDSIAVTFETIGYNQGRGNIYGVRTELVAAKNDTLGFSYLAQTSDASAALQSRTQQFYGFGTPGAAYILDAPIDSAQPISVKVGGIPLQQGVDFVVDARLLNQIRIVSAIPSTVLIEIAYVPLNTNATPGNRSVFGIDNVLQLGALGSLRAEMAMSGLSLQGNSYGGNAFQLRADLNLIPARKFAEPETAAPNGKKGERFQPTLRTTLAFRDISPTFSSVQAANFNRNETAYDFSADYRPKDGLRFNASFQNSLRPSYSASSSTVTQILTNGTDKYNQYTLGAGWEKGRLGATLNRNSSSTKFAIGGDSENTNNVLALNYKLGRVGLDFSLNSSDSAASTLYANGTATSLYNSSATNTGVRYGVNWQTSSWLNLSASASANAIKSLSESASATANNINTTAHDSEIRARITPNKMWRINYAFNLSDTGDLGAATSTTTGSGGTGLPGTRLFTSLPSRDLSAGGGISPLDGAGSVLGGGSNYNLGNYGSYSGFLGSGLNTGYGASSFGGKSSGHHFQVDYQLKKLNLGMSLNTASSLGTYQYNSDRKSLTFLFGYQPSQKVRFDMSIGTQKIDYSGAIGGSSGKTFTLGMSVRPLSRMNLSIDWMSVNNASNINFSALSGGSGQGATDTSVNLASLRTRLDYNLSGRWTLFSELLNSTTQGYLGGDESHVRFGADFALTQTFRFTFGWQTNSRSNSDPQNALYNYRVSSVLAEFGFNFR